MPLVADYGTSSDDSDHETTPAQQITKAAPSKSTRATTYSSIPTTSVKVDVSQRDSEDVLEDFVKKTDYGM